jgi:hypothetical protein
VWVGGVLENMTLVVVVGGGGAKYGDDRQ